jgi:predicted class III extradiol MEMO1 family dioxygenase
MRETQGVCQNTIMIRPPAVAGRFYTADARELARQIKDFCAEFSAMEKKKLRRAAAWCRTRVTCTPAR